MGSSRIWIVAAILLLAALSARELYRASGPRPGDPAPPFAATALNGQSVSLADSRGREAVLLNFFSAG